MGFATGLKTKLGIELNSGSNWETGAALALGANSGILADDFPIVDDRPILSAISLGQARPSSHIQQAIEDGGEFKKKFRFGGKDNQLLAACLGSVETVSYRDLVKIVDSTATGGSTTTLVDSTAPFGADDLQIGKILIIKTGTGAYQVLAVTDSTSDTLTFATATAPVNGDTYELVDFGPAIYDICDGTATSTTVTVATNTSMTVNVHAGSWITIIAGTGVGQTRGIASNTADTITVNAAWTTTPDATSKVDVMGDACTKIYAIGEPEGIYFTMCAYNGSYIKEHPHFKPGAFTLTGVYNDFITISYVCVGDKEVTDSAINTDQTLWTIREQENEVPVKKTTTSLLMNRQDTDALEVGGTDERQVNDFTLEFIQSIEGVLRTGSGDDNIKSEPIQNAHPEYNLAFTEPLIESAGLKVERAGDYAQKASLIITGDALNPNQNREMVILMPQVVINEVGDPINDAGFIQAAVTTMLEDATAAPAGISYTDAFKIEITDDYGGNPIQVGNT